MKLPIKKYFVLGCILALTGCGGGHVATSAPVVPYGPAADYPMVLGAPFTVNGVLYTPADTLNYDEVGKVTLDAEGGAAITGEHRTLPLPSYVEVTSLQTGRTILVRLERRGPMTGGTLIGLSSGAMGQLGATEGTPVRVRRVNPPEQERAMLRRGERAPERMDTPMSLVEVLRRKLPVEGAAPVDPAHQASTKHIPAKGLDKPPQQQNAVAPPAQTPARAAHTAKPDGRGYVVQAGAFSIEENARKVAAKIGGTIDKSGNLYRVRTGPFPSRKEADASLAKIKGAGYSGARIYSVN
ncbi:hypothetical protein MB02_03295 [Croceicoccus estronivorus]|uniref:SPOR domain-containing protein n=1 Tax=Croceicoccus estronivorus TaxID=1172626 RepID=UPI0008375B42|nr:SPOR domain-containing protein [Croceicoccus estronivorus]OCC24530.1 hypothetical protein MB02_03295 [Croceicoccus estronivorus]